MPRIKPVSCHSQFIWATGKYRNVGTETETGKRERKREQKQPERCGEREPVLWPYSRQESQISLN